MKSTLKTIAYVALILVISIIVAITLKITSPKATPTLKGLSPPVITAFKIHRKSLTPEIRLTGRLQPSHKVQLKFELSGRVSDRLVEPGQKVITGQELIKLNAGDYVDTLTQARAQHTLERAGIQRDKQLLIFAQRNTILQAKEVARHAKLGKGSLISKSLLDKARQKLYQLQSEEVRLKFSVDTSIARLKLRQSAIERANRNLRRTKLVAPFPGVINAVYVEKGDFVSPSKLVVELISVKQVQLLLHIRNRLASALKLGLEVDVYIDSKRYKGVIVGLQADPDSSTFTHELRIRLPQGVSSPGVIARVILKLDRLRKIIAVPASAVLREQESAYVMVLKNDKVKLRYVTLGKRIKDWQIIQQGLNAGETIVSRDIASLKDGQIVNPKTKFYSRKSE